ncbi:hypothetical protein [Pseudomonas sp. JL3]|uniref:hypothetical protein n=1 Tax=Pseudomonas sp. JL3 TaxID=2919943 RepID=UPI002866BA10|nr:hypothetical protein [Pseudomonas sp. JL3]MDR8363978.1 hypothetical protein [Pseudomonas sp. JL3]
MSIAAEFFFLLMFFAASALIHSEKTANKKLFLSFYVTYIFFYDYINYYLGLAFGADVIVFKLGTEIFLLSALLKIFLHGRMSVQAIKPLLACALLVAVAAIIGLNKGYNPKSIYIDFRSAHLPIIFSIVLIEAGGIKGVKFEHVFKTVVLLTLFNGVYSIYEYMAFNGNYENIWRYQSLLNSKMEVNSDYNEAQLAYQMVRDDNLRAAGFLVSALIAAYIYGFIAIHLICNILVFKKSRRVFLDGMLLVAYIVFSYITQVRTSFLMVGIALLFIYSLKLVKSGKAKQAVAIGASVSLVTGLFVFLSSNVGVKDASSLGRIAQYNTFFSDLTLLGGGLGSYPRSFDSFYIYSILELGVFSLILYYTLFRMSVTRKNPSLEQKRFGIYTLLQFSLFLFVCSFQHISGSMYYFLIVFLLSYNHLSTERKEHYLKNNLPFRVVNPISYEVRHQ